MHFTFNLQTNQLTQAFAALRYELAYPKGLLESVGETLLNSNRARHEQALAPDGSPWKPLAASTLAADALKKGGSGKSRRPLWKTSEMLGKRFAYQVNDHVLQLGFDINRALWHHEGTKPYEIRPKVAKALAFGGVVAKRVHHPGLPARPLLGMPTGDERLAENAVADYLKVVLKRF